jgi:hypothetical protein
MKDFFIIIFLIISVFVIFNKKGMAGPDPRYPEDYVLHANCGLAENGIVLEPYKGCRVEIIIIPEYRRIY